MLLRKFYFSELEMIEPDWLIVQCIDLLSINLMFLFLNLLVGNRFAMAGVRVPVARTVTVAQNVSNLSKCRRKSEP